MVCTLQRTSTTGDCVDPYSNFKPGEFGSTHSPVALVCCSVLTIAIATSPPRGLSRLHALCGCRPEVAAIVALCVELWLSWPCVLSSGFQSTAKAAYIYIYVPLKLYPLQGTNVGDWHFCVAVQPSVCLHEINKHWHSTAVHLPTT